MSALAAEGLNRFGGLVAALGGADAELYLTLLLLSLLTAIVFAIAFFIPIPKPIKWVLFIALLIASGLMFFAPNFPVTTQILIGLVGAAAAMTAVPVRQSNA